MAMPGAKRASLVRPRLEVPIFGPDDADTAVSHGASRLELNRAGSYALGGTTPTLQELSTLLAYLAQHSATTRPVIRIMIRPRGPPLPPPLSSSLANQARDKKKKPQDFLYTPDEISTMESSIRDFVSSGLLDPERGDGFVFGVLRNTEEGRVELDVDGNKRLVALAITGKGERYRCVLHRAVDGLLSRDGVEDRDGGGSGRSMDVAAVMERVRECGFDGVLTSGGKGNAVSIIHGLKRVVEERRGLEVIVGGGVRRGNLRELVEGMSGAGGGLGEGVWFHSSCLGSEERFAEEEARGLAREMRQLSLVL